MSLDRTAAVFIAAIVFCFAANISRAASAGTLSFEKTAQQETQNKGLRRIPVTRTGGSSGTAGAVCKAVSGTALLGTDFEMTTTTLQWGAGDATAQYCVVTILDGKPYRGDKSFVLELSSVTGATIGSIGKQTVTISGNLGGGTVALSTATYSVEQSAGTATLTVDRTGGAVGAAVVYYATANITAAAGTHYTLTAGKLSWSNGDAAPKSISIPLNNAKPFSGSKTFAVALAYPENVVLGAQASTIVTIEGAADTGNDANSALLSWSPPTKNTNGTPVTALAGYTVHYGTSQEALTKSVAVSGASTTSYELAGLTKGTWYFAISAAAKDGTKGPLSSIGSKTIGGSTAPTTGFTLSDSPGSITLIHGGVTGGMLDIAVAPIAGFTGTVTFALAGLPANVDYAWLPAASTTGSTLVLYATAYATPGTYTVHVTGTSGSTTSSTPLEMIIE